MSLFARSSPNRDQWLARVDGLWSESCSPPSEAEDLDSKPSSGEIRSLGIALNVLTKIYVLKRVFVMELGLLLSCCCGAAAVAAAAAAVKPSKTAKLIVPALPMARSPSANACPTAKIILPPLPLAEPAWSGPAKKPPVVPALPCPTKSKQQQQQQLMEAGGQEVSLRSEHGLRTAQATTPEGFIWRSERTGQLVTCMPSKRGRDLLQRALYSKEHHEPPVFAEPLSDDWEGSAGPAPPASRRAAEPRRAASRSHSLPPAEPPRGLSSSNHFPCHSTGLCLFTMSSHSTERMVLCTADEAVDPSGRGPIPIMRVNGLVACTA